MATRHEIIVGDSYSYDITCESVPTFDANWTGKWAIVDKLGEGRVTAADGDLVISGDASALEMRILPTDTSGIDAGNYFLVVQVTNTTLGFNQEIMQDTLIMKKQGI